MTEPDEESDAGSKSRDSANGSGLEAILERIGTRAEECDRLSVGGALDAVGRRSFGPLLVVAGLLILAPVIGDIPGVPTLLGTVVILVASQLLLRREHVWIPEWLSKRSVSGGKARKALDKLRPVARFLDRWTKPRLTKLVDHTAAAVIAVACIVIASATPIMEFIPFSANLAGAAITAFGLALVARDGLLALVALACSLGVVGVAVYVLL